MKAMLVLLLVLVLFFIIIAKTSYIYIEYFGIKQTISTILWYKFYYFNSNDKSKCKSSKTYEAKNIAKYATLIQFCVGIIFLLIHKRYELDFDSYYNSFIYEYDGIHFEIVCL